MDMATTESEGEGLSDSEGSNREENLRILIYDLIHSIIDID